jgi:hypothetical protein
VDGDAPDDPVEAEAEGLALLGGGNGVEEEAAAGDLGAALVAEGIIDDQPEGAGRDEADGEEQQEGRADAIPVPLRGVEEGVSEVVVAPGGQSGGLPNFAEGVRPGAEGPGGDDQAEGVEDLLAEAVAEGG